MAEIYSTGQKSTDALKGGLKFEQDNNRIIGRDANNIPSLIIYSDPGGTGFIMKISKPTYDVTTCTNDQLIFNSAQNNLKFVTSGTVTLPSYNINSSSGWASFSVAIPPNAVVTHNLGRQPIVFAYILATGPGGPTSIALPSSYFNLKGTGGVQFRDIGYSVSNTTIEFGDNTLTNGNVGSYESGALNVQYFIFQESTGV